MIESVQQEHGESASSWNTSSSCLSAGMVVYLKPDLPTETSMAEQMRAVAPKPKPTHKACPFCAETIKLAAIKCKHCGESVVQSNEPPCKQCGGIVRPATVQVSETATAAAVFGTLLLVGGGLAFLFVDILVGAVVGVIGVLLFLVREQRNERWLACANCNAKRSKL